MSVIANNIVLSEFDSLSWSYTVDEKKIVSRKTLYGIWWFLIDNSNMQICFCDWQS